MSKTFRAWDVDQCWLLPPSVHEFVAPGHVAHFIRDTVRETLDLSAILAAYEEDRGYPPYHPGMMVALLLYGYSRGVYSSRQLARACEERVDFMAVAGLNRPDFRTIGEFRRRHLAALSALFLQVLRLCRQAGLVRLGHVAAQRPSDLDPDGPGPSSGMQKSGRPERAKDGGPPDRAQRNFTDPDSRILPTRDGFIAGYNAQIAVDAAHQIIVAQRLVTSAADVGGLVPLVDAVRAGLGRKPAELSGDTGFASEANLAAMAARRIRAYLSPGRAHAGQSDGAAARLKNQPRMMAMAATLKRAGYRSRYRLRKQVVEPLFGHIKQARGFRQFLLRGLNKVRAEWAMICTAHNLLKLAAAAA